MNYRPNARAPRIRAECHSGHLVYPQQSEPAHPFHSAILQGVEEYCESTGFFVMFAKYDYSPNTDPADLKLPGVLRSHGIADCLILAGTNYDNFVDTVEKLGMPHVVLSNHHVTSKKVPPFDRAGWDDATGPYDATRFLITLGHRSIWYIGDTSLPWYKARYDSYSRAMKEAGLEPLGQIVVCRTITTPTAMHVLK